MFFSFYRVFITYFKLLIGSLLTVNDSLQPERTWSTTNKGREVGAVSHRNKAHVHQKMNAKSYILSIDCTYENDWIQIDQRTPWSSLAWMG